MKHIVLLIAFACCITACEKDNNSSRFDDLISSFDLSQMDQDQFVAALTTDMLCVNDVDIYTKDQGWGALVDGGGSPGWLGILCSSDGTSKFIAEFAPTGRLEGIYCTSGHWEYSSHTGDFIIDTFKNNNITNNMKAKIVYYKYPRLILEGVRGNDSWMMYRWDCSFSKEDPQKLLDSCTIFIDVDE